MWRKLTRPRLGTKGTIEAHGGLNWSAQGRTWVKPLNTFREHRHETIRLNNRIWDDSNKRPLSSSISLFSRGGPRSTHERIHRKTRDAWRVSLSLSPSPASCRCEHTLTHARVSTTMWKVRCIFNTRHASMPVEMGPIIRRGREFTTKEATPSGVPCYLVWGKFPVKRREGSLLALVTAFLVIKIRISPPLYDWNTKMAFDLFSD